MRQYRLVDGAANIDMGENRGLSLCTVSTVSRGTEHGNHRHKSIERRAYAGEIFTTLREAKVLIENWRKHYNAAGPHSSLNYRPPAPEAILPPARGLPYAPHFAVCSW